jgi:hypothetical protein
LWPPSDANGFRDQPRVVQAYLSDITGRPDSTVISIRAIVAWLSAHRLSDMEMERLAMHKQLGGRRLRRCDPAS